MFSFACDLYTGETWLLFFLHLWGFHFAQLRVCNPRLLTPKNGSILIVSDAAGEELVNERAGVSERQLWIKEEEWVLQAEGSEWDS